MGFVAAPALPRGRALLRCCVAVFVVVFVAVFVVVIVGVVPAVVVLVVVAVEFIVQPSVPFLPSWLAVVSLHRPDVPHPARFVGGGGAAALVVAVVGLATPLNHCFRGFFLVGLR